MTHLAPAPFPIEFDSSWLGFGGVHGGLVVAALIRAAAVETGATPLAVSAHFTGPVQPGPVDVAVDDVRGGRTVSARASMPDSVTALVRLARTVGETTWPRTGSDFGGTDPVTLPPLEIPVDFVPFSQYLDIRPINAARPFGRGDNPEFEVWIRLMSAVGFAPVERAAILLDALPPGLFATMSAPVPVPTVEFAAHFAPSRAAADGWYHLRHRTVWATEMLCVDEAELTDGDGHLVGQARQLRRILGG
ncbi:MULTISPECIES: acyl-CoA thioesterase [unclassified Rhodococcus (in: high G+C Gram-positive bacteria)]|uniref:acyl-CoA thioesterase n=1 Tax=unclassified Rhodococcus (in: high G+C Gram-positive bacteria) TaxID=192944 RepID=UPI00092CD9CE|nr:thioesterase family protein [Rhodococcus sp. M8]OLL20658.1 TesB-like acyl-CoA thioesterase 1 [Rhodococcus sp. M8]QPG44508.1 thioesterase family protein [Rhodococcus sp. M8]